MTARPALARPGDEPRERRGLITRVRRSLAARVLLEILAAGTVVLAVILAVVTVYVRNDVFNDRRATILGDAQQRVAAAQTAFDASGATSSGAVASLAETEVTQIRDSAAGAGAVGVVLLRARDETSARVTNDLTTDDRLARLPSDALRKAVDSGTTGSQYWQSVSVPSGTGEAPGIIVGSLVSLPVGGDYEMYLVYTMGPEQHFIDLSARAILAAGAGFLLLLLVGGAFITGRVVAPVRRISAAAGRLAEGHTEERVEVRGQDELAALGRSFNEMADSLEAQLEAWEQLSQSQRHFVSDVSHELRTPLAAIRLASDSLEGVADGTLPPAVAKRPVEILGEQVDRFDEMLKDLLEISRMDSGRITLRPEEQDVAGLVGSVLTAVALPIKDKRVTVTLEVPEEPVVAELEAGRIEGIVRNFVVNALEHDEGGRVEVVVAGNEDAVAVRVRDHGIGMSPDVVPQVFDRFYRADPSRKRTLGGTGLGLSIALESARLHGGTLSVWGWPGEGASFLMTLPRRLAPDGTAGTWTRPGPLDVVPEDAPRVSRSAVHEAGAPVVTTAATAAVPASRRTSRPDPSTPDDAADSAATAPSGLPTAVVMPGPAGRRSARTPEEAPGADEGRA